LLDGNRGLISNLEKQSTYKELKLKENDLKIQIRNLEHKNSLLTDNLDLDFIEILIREKFLFGKTGETTYIIDNDKK
jgi:Septum formation initiator.